jgi:hypothetical protein
MFSPKSLGNRSYGNYFDLISGGTLFRGAHLQGFARAGGLVQQGELLGYVDSTGNSTGNHLHAEVRENGVIKNPRSYFGGGGPLPGGGSDSGQTSLDDDTIDRLAKAMLRGMAAMQAGNVQAMRAGVRR